MMNANTEIIREWVAYIQFAVVPCQALVRAGWGKCNDSRQAIGGNSEGIELASDKLARRTASWLG